MSSPEEFAQLVGRVRDPYRDRGRLHGLNCVHIRQRRKQQPEQRDHFAKLARTWIKLAEELEQTEAFLAAIEDEEPTKKAG